MKEKLAKLGKKLKKLLIRLLLLALACCCAYLLYVHRRVLFAAIKGEKLPACHHKHKCFCKKK